MLTRAKVFSLTMVALLVLTLTPGAPITAAPRTRTGRIETDTFDSATNDPPNPAHPLFSAGAQTSGGLLIAVPQERLEALLAALASAAWSRRHTEDEHV